MTSSSRFPAVVAYLIPVIGWFYVYLFQRNNAFALFHLRQAVGLVLFLIAAVVTWYIAFWILAWIPLMGTVGMALFTLVIAAYMYGLVAWIMGMRNALNNKAVPLPWFGRWASRLPI